MSRGESNEPGGRLAIARRDAIPLVPGKVTFLDLPGELRNAIYHLALEKDYQRVPLNPIYLNKPDPYITLLQTCSAIYHEARSYMGEKQTAYVPVLPGIDWKYGEPAADYGLSRATKDTTACALTDFMSVHFHLHLDLFRREDYDPDALLASLEEAIKIFSKRSWSLYLAHDLRKRRAAVHLDHLLSLWPKLFHEANCVDFGILRHLIEIMSDDKMTDWEIRYYVATGQAGVQSEYGSCCSASVIRDAELAQLRSFVRPYGNIKIVAEIYGDDTTWEFGDETGCVTRTRTPVTEFWPNLHFDARFFDFPYNGSYPDEMPIENFDEEVLQATHARPGGREVWLMEIEKQIQMRAAETHGISTWDRQILDVSPLSSFAQGWKEALECSLMEAEWMTGEDEEGGVSI